MLLNQITVRAHTEYVCRLNAVEHEAQVSMSVCVLVWSALVCFSFRFCFLPLAKWKLDRSENMKRSGKIRKQFHIKQKNRWTENMPFNCCSANVRIFKYFCVSILTPAEMLMFQMSHNSTWQCHTLTTCITHCITLRFDGQTCATVLFFFFSFPYLLSQFYLCAN